MADLRWNEQAGRFVGPGGRFVSESAVRAVIDQIADAASDRMAASATAMLEGRMSLAAFQAEAMQTIKLAHLSTATIAHGGAESMTFSHYGSVGRQIRDEYAFMRGFADDIASGRQPLNGSLTARARQYGQASRVTYEKIRGADAVARGQDEARNILHAQESCSECRAIAARGWMPASEMLPVGARRCRSNCRCTISRRRHPVEVAA